MFFNIIGLVLAIIAFFIVIKIKDLSYELNNEEYSYYLKFESNKSNSKDYYDLNDEELYELKGKIKKYKVEIETKIRNYSIEVLALLSFSACFIIAGIFR